MLFRSDPALDAPAAAPETGAEPVQIEAPPKVTEPATRRGPRPLSRFAGTPEHPHRYVRGLRVRVDHAGSRPAAVVEWSGLEPPVALVLQQVQLRERRWFGGKSTGAVRPFDDLRQDTPLRAAQDAPSLSVFLVGVASAHVTPAQQNLSASASPDAGAQDGPTVPEAGPDAPRPPPPSTLYVDGACA